MIDLRLGDCIINKNDIVYTPEHIARDVVDHFNPSGICLDPCKGDGAFLRCLPIGADWCEIREGRDFFKYDKPVDWIISNPPFSNYYEFLIHAFRLADNVVYLLPMGKLFQSMRNLRAVFEYGGMPECYIVGTGSEINFNMGFAIGAVYCKRGYTGATSFTFAQRRITEAQAQLTLQLG